MPAANRSIEISSPRLHCGRAAFYRSIIIPLTCRRVMEVPLPYQCSWFCLPDRRIAARCQGNVSVEAVSLSRFMAHKVPVSSPNPHGFQTLPLSEWNESLPYSFSPPPFSNICLNCFNAWERCLYTCCKEHPIWPAISFGVLSSTKSRASISRLCSDSVWNAFSSRSSSNWNAPGSVIPCI